MAIGAACGALLVVQVLARRHMSAGLVAALAVGLPCALFAVGAMLLAQMPWYLLPLLLLPLVAIGSLSARDMRPMVRGSMLAGVALGVAFVPVAAGRRDP